MSTVARPRAVCGTGKKNSLGVENRGLTMYNCLSASIASFPALPVTLVVFLALVTALATARGNLTATKAKGLGALRDTKREALWTAMELVRSYVQSLADTMSAVDAASLIHAAGLVVAAQGKRNKPILAAVLTSASGVARLIANATALVGKAAARRKLTFNWQSSVDGKTWINVAATPGATVDVPGLTLMTTYSFRVSVTVGKVTGDWSQAVSLLVH